jgi:hypothetical protein
MGDAIKYLRRKDAAAYLKENYGHSSERSLSKLATIGGGPVYRKVGRIVVYTKSDLDAWALAKISAPVTSTSEYDTQERAA